MKIKQNEGKKEERNKKPSKLCIFNKLVSYRFICNAITKSPPNLQINSLKWALIVHVEQDRMLTFKKHFIISIVKNKKKIKKYGRE